MFLLRSLTIISFLMALQGCFYQVERGKGGVAERFDLSFHFDPSSFKQAFLQRLLTAEQKLKTEYQQRQSRAYSALFWEAHMQLNESRRLFKADYYQQASLNLSLVEQVIELIQTDKQQQAFALLCKETTYREVCL